MSEELPQPPELETTPVTAPEPSEVIAPVSTQSQSGLAWIKPMLLGLSVSTMRLIVRSLERVLHQLETASIKHGVEILPRIEAKPGSGALVGTTARRSRSAKTGEVPQFLNRLQDLWEILLGLVRSWLPAPLRRNLPNNVLSILVSGVLIVLLWTTSSLLPGKSKPAVVAKAPPLEAAPELIAPPELAAPAATEPIAIETPPTPPPMVTPSPTVTPTPKVELTPEQIKIAAIQDDVVEITNQYASGLIESIQANFQSSRLKVKVSEGWYGLTQLQQDKLADEVFDRTQKLAFTKLEFTDAQDTLLARSPVVGSNMVILQRQPQA